MSRPILLSPHNDDCELFACFLALRFKPLVIVVLRSEKQAVDGITAAQRELETASAMDVLGCDWVQWPVGDRQPNWVKVAALLRDHADAKQVFAPAFEQKGHDQHNDIALLALHTFPHERITNYLTYTSEGKSAWGEPVPFEDEWVPLKLQALSCYESQMSHPKQVAHFMRDFYEYVAL